MFRSRQHKEEHRYYLLPGMGKSNRRFHQRTLKWAVAFGLLVSALLGLILYLAQGPRL